MDLSTTYLDLPLRTPLVASPSALTATTDGLRRLEDAGASAVVLASLFEEEILLDSMDLDAAVENWVMSFGEAPSYFEELRSQRTGPEKYLKFIEEAKHALDVPVIASLNVHSPGLWMDQLERIDGILG